jgi:hypothetical protein
MSLTTVERPSKQRCFLFTILVVASMLLTIAIFNTTTVYGAGSVQKQQKDLGSGIDMTVKIPVSAMKSSQVDLLVFFTRPVPCTQNHDNCFNNIKSYAPDSTMSCSIPIPQSQKSATSNSSWAKDGKECPYLNCNWMSATQGCSSLTKDTEFRSLPSPIAGLGNVYMSQIIDYKTQDKNQNTVGLMGCIYYANWPKFPTQYTQLVLSVSGRQLLSGTLPKGVTLKTIQNILTSSGKQSAKTQTWTPS